MSEPCRDRGQVIVLAKRIERDPDTEAFGERDLFLDRFARMNFVTQMLRFEIFAEELGQHMAAIRRRVDQHVAGGAGDRSVEHHLERLVARLVGIERQVITEHDESLGAVCDKVDDIRQIDQIALVDLDQAQTLVAVLGQHRLDERRLAGAA